MAAQLELAEQMRRRMLSDVAHELRHPLHVLQGNLQAMVDGIYPLSEEEVERLIIQTRHLTVLVNDLHILAQAEARQLPLNIRQVDIARLIKDVAAAYQPLADARSIDLHVELLGTVPAAIEVDQDRMRQALQNLMENALRHTPDGGHMRFEVEAAGDQLVIKVVDTGQGIAEDQLPLVFDRLYRGDQARARTAESTGLGLAIARAILEAHGGRITAYSEGPGYGSTFTIRLPLSGPN
jgi:signal transduction histidine kinase